jgi:hypothetical protein
VKIDLIVRGICCLRPNVPGLSENIRVISIVGRFLEHSRVYYFENAGEPVVYLASADWMPRNLLRPRRDRLPDRRPTLRDELIKECSLLPGRHRQGARIAAGRHLQASSAGERRGQVAGAAALPRAFAAPGSQDGRAQNSAVIKLAPILTSHRLTPQQSARRARSSGKGQNPSRKERP